jgi:hypothetical protein
VDLINDKYIVSNENNDEFTYLSQDFQPTQVFVRELVCFYLRNRRKYILQDELSQFKIWRTYGISSMKFVRYLCNENLLLSHQDNNDQIYYTFSFDVLNDYFIAKHIFKILAAEGPVKSNRIDAEILKLIKHPEIQKSYAYTPIAIQLSVLCAGRFNYTCENLLSKISDQNFRNFFITSYIETFKWRNAKAINTLEFEYLSKKYSNFHDNFMDVLLHNSLKQENPLNVYYLHRYLFPMKLNCLDLNWTVYISKMFLKKDARIIQLLNLYYHKKRLPTDNKEIQSILLLFSWFLSSTDRKLRDITSIVMVEILKTHIELCEPLLKKFARVNDPYIIQRLYGITFGAVCKCVQHDKEKIFLNLAHYVFTSIFAVEEVYPDILLRDYARLIIDRFVYEYPSHKSTLALEKIMPPYQSKRIYTPRHAYSEDVLVGGEKRIVDSMKPSIFHPYGEFGRYVFQSALSQFDVNINKMFNYAIYYIFHVLGYKNEYFDEFDIKNHPHRLTDTPSDKFKIERIGKKYQWIAMYNILARVSDHYPLKYDDSYTCSQKFEGAWEPYVRDFDPTLNEENLCSPEMPKFPYLNTLNQSFYNSDEIGDLNKSNNVLIWLGDSKDIISFINDSLKLKDCHGNDWILLQGVFHLNVKEDLGMDKSSPYLCVNYLQV